MLLITGASGNVGKALAQLLGQRGLDFRVAHRAPLTTRTRPHSEAVRLDFADPATFSAALAGCDAVFLMRPPAISNTRRTLNLFIDAARSCGVRHIVFLSVVGADQHAWVPHHAVENHLRAGALDWTILRPSFFAQNLEGAYLADICDAHRIYLPAGSGKATFIDTRDIAEVAALALGNPQSHAGRAYTLTGPQALGFDEVAAILSTVLGHAVHYERASLAGYAMHLHRQGLPAAQILVQTALHAGLRLGQGTTFTHTVEQLLSRKATSLQT